MILASPFDGADDIMARIGAGAQPALIADSIFSHETAIRPISCNCGWSLPVPAACAYLPAGKSVSAGFLVTAGAMAAKIAGQAQAARSVADRSATR